MDRQGRKIRFAAERRAHSKSIAVVALVDVGDKALLATNTTWVELQPDEVVPYGDEWLSLSDTEAQNLMDELYRAGVRPSGVDTPGQIAAMQRHLDDMRRLVFESRPPLAALSPIPGGIMPAQQK